MHSQMTNAAHIARHFRQFYHGKNWTWVWFEEVMKDVDWELATRQVGTFNTIAVLVYHMNYYVRLQLHVLKGGSMKGYDMDPFHAPEVKGAADWNSLLQSVYTDGEALAALVEGMADEDLEKTFLAEQYGSVYRNLHGNIEHMHYHLGQIVLLKKWMETSGN